MKHEIYATAIIPAKVDSTRLPKKNLQVIDGKTLLEHSLDYAQNSEYIKDIIVSGRASNGTAKALKASHSTNGTTPGNTAVLTVQKTRESDISSSNFRKTINANAERLKIKVEPQAAGDECGAVSILFKTKRSPR